MTSFLDVLNPEQQKAVMHIHGPVMVIAGPGSGKTRVLTYRLAYLLHQGIKPHNILSLTFTNKAAREMTDRIAQLVGDEVRKVWSGTFHSIFARILRVEAPKIGYPSAFSIYDTDDTKSVIADILKELNLNPKEYNPNTIRNRISSAKSNLITPVMYERDASLLEQDEEIKMPRLFEIYKKYVQQCIRSGAMDFDDLLLQLFRLLQENPEQVLEKYRNQFRFLLVDEFQDTNFLQYAIIKKLVLYPESPRNICIVGDDAQSIYAFRGATIKNILDFERDFPDAAIFKLEQNYRSTPDIVNAANDVITYNQKQIRKEIWTQNETGNKIKLMKCATDVEEGRKVADYVIELKNRYHLRNQEIAILYRTNAQSRIFEEQLRRVNISYKVFGGLSFYQRKEIKDLLAYLRLIVNLKDDEAFKRIINYPKRGIGDSSIDKFRRLAVDQNLSLWDASSLVELGTKAAQALKQFKMQILEVQQSSHKSDAYNTAMYAFKISGMSAELKQDITNEGIQRLENVMALLDGIKSFTEEDEWKEAELKEKSLAAYLQSISLITQLDESDDQADYISLMSVHSAKGLEFGAVIVGGMEENLFPSYLASREVDQMDEERRLFYVAITRAKRFLALSYANTRYVFGNLRMSSPSRFLDEIQPERMEIDKNFNRSNIFELQDNRPPESRKWVEAKPKFTKEVIQHFAASPSEAIQSGMVVLHQKFGKGKVLHIEGVKDNRVATILFQEIDNPQRKIILKFAKLQILN